MSKALKITKNPKIFCDFDGTISLIDTTDLLVDYCMGLAAHEAVDNKIVSGELSFRQGLTALMNEVNLTWPEAWEQLQVNKDIDPTFKAFVKWTEQQNIPLVVLSSGFKQIIQTYFKANALGHLPIQANQIDVQDRTWHIQFKDSTPFGHDKAAALKTAKAKGYHIIFIGDGISDLPAARFADILFAKRGKRLAAYCQQQKIAYHAFKDFGDVLQVLDKVFSVD